MQRALYEELRTWKRQKNRLPLIVRGARQVGKSFLIETFGKREFKDLHVINFEKKPELAQCFESLDPKDILKELEPHIGKRIEEGNSLLFLDEIQDCPQALKALRYFAEEMPRLHVIAAGSLLEFVLEEKAFSFPVGRVQMMNLGPLTFKEYLSARGQEVLLERLQSVELSKGLSITTHNLLLKFVREFSKVGGMPGVVSTFLATESYLEVQRRQSAILDLYALDFAKYSTKYAEHRHLKKLFERAPELVGKHFKFSKIDPDCANPARDYREALNRLRQARLILPVHLSKGNGLPLRSEKSEKKFKIFLLDVGLLAFGLGAEVVQKEREVPSFRGVLSEQLVAQELYALQDPFIDRGLYYWENSSPTSSAEIDFLMSLDHKMLPIEVKAGAAGSLKSLRQFMSLKKISTGIQISEHELGLKEGILQIPFYLIQEVPRILSKC